MSEGISVIVPIYNAERFIEKCLDSIVSQTIENLEIICVNDGSKDDSLNMLYAYQKRHINRRIVVIDQENRGPSSARNAGMDYATQKYIAFVDSDDYIEPKMYENLIQIAEAENLDVVMCNILNRYEDGSETASAIKVTPDTRIGRSEILESICPTLMREDIFGGPCNRIYRRYFLEEHQIRMHENIGYGEDAVFQMQVFDCLENTWFDSHGYYYYIHREGSQTSPRPAMFQTTFEPLYQIRSVYAKKWGISESIVSNHFVYCTIMDIVNTISGDYRHKRQYLSCIWESGRFRHALKTSNIRKSDYTSSIFFVYRILKRLMK